MEKFKKFAARKKWKVRLSDSMFSVCSGQGSCLLILGIGKCIHLTKVQSVISCAVVTYFQRQAQTIFKCYLTCSLKWNFACSFSDHPQGKFLNQYNKVTINTFPTVKNHILNKPVLPGEQQCLELVQKPTFLCGLVGGTGMGTNPGSMAWSLYQKPTFLLMGGMLVQASLKQSKFKDQKVMAWLPVLKIRSNLGGASPCPLSPSGPVAYLSFTPIKLRLDSQQGLELMS